MTLKERIALWIARLGLKTLVERLVDRPLTRKENKMLSRIFGNWQTTLIGIALGALQLHQGGMSLGSALKATLFAMLGGLAKDAVVGSAPGVK